jgi:glycosyltransferase involved in cell wall biosynthesis
MSEIAPFVSILTPVYNGDAYLVECIESVLAQTYENWEYIIVNNCSTDRTLEIAKNYANKDKRIKVICNHHFVNAEENHNIAFSLISKDSRYCKVVSADDMLTSNCVEKMVILANAHPSIRIVGSHQLRGEEVMWKGLPTHIAVLSGRDTCRMEILHNAQIFGNPTSELYNSEIIKKNTPFYPNSQPYADISACFKYLQEGDFGFVHEVLSMERIHEQQVSSTVRKLGMDNLGCLDNFLTYGTIYLSNEEYEREKMQKLDAYHRWLGGCLLKMKGAEFWQYQQNALKELGHPIRWVKIIIGALDEIRDEMKDPTIALQKFLGVLKAKSR